MLIREHNKMLDEIEKSLDAYGLDQVIMLLGEVCSVKADYIREGRDKWNNWKIADELADEWDHNAAAILNLRLKIINARVPKPLPDVQAAPDAHLDDMGGLT